MLNKLMMCVGMYNLIFSNLRGVNVKYLSMIVFLNRFENLMFLMLMFQSYYYMLNSFICYGYDVSSTIYTSTRSGFRLTLEAKEKIVCMSLFFKTLISCKKKNPFGWCRC